MSEDITTIDGYDIIQDERYNHGQPSVESGYTVLQVLQLLEGEYDEEGAAERLNVSVEEVEEAQRYYEDNQAEIEQIRAEQERVIEEYSLTGSDDV